MVRSSCSALALLLAAAAPAAAQSALYSNGSANPSDPGLATGTVTASGVPAPIGSQWSELQGAGDAGCNAIAGFSGHMTAASGAFRFADDFTVPASGYRLDRVALFAYQTGAPAMTAPAGELNLRLWNGPPGAPGSVVIFGDTTTDRLASATPSNLYRVLSTAVAPLGGPPDTSRLIWRLEADLGGLDLGAGTYWLDWQFAAANPDAEVFTPPVTAVGVRSLPGWNALQLKAGAAGAAWLPLVDPGKPAPAADLPQDLPFILLGGAACPADFNGDTLVNSNDISAFLTAWLAGIQGGSLDADFNGDLVVNSNDISAFLTAWLGAVQNGC